MGKLLTRMGDGFRVEMTEQEVRQDLEAGTLDAADRAKVSPLKEDELKYLYDMFACPDRVVGVEPGHEVCLSYDAATTKLKRANISVSKIQSLQILERALGADSLELAHIDYSFKPVKPIVTFEKPIMEQALLTTIAPLFYGAMPNLGLYSQPDGPCPNPADLLPKGKIAEARASYEQAIELATNDMVHVGSVMYEAGADGINFRYDGRRRRCGVSCNAAGRGNSPEKISGDGHPVGYGSGVRPWHARRGHVRGRAPGGPLSPRSGQAGKAGRRQYLWARGEHCDQ